MLHEPPASWTVQRVWSVLVEKQSTDRGELASGKLIHGIMGLTRGLSKNVTLAVSRAHKLPGLVECFPKVSKRAPTSSLWLNEKSISWKLLEK